MKNAVITFLAVLLAIAVALVGYDMWKDRQARTSQGYRTHAYITQGMSLAAYSKVVIANNWQMMGELATPVKCEPRRGELFLRN